MDFDNWRSSEDPNFYEEETFKRKSNQNNSWIQLSTKKQKTSTSKDSFENNPSVPRTESSKKLGNGLSNSVSPQPSLNYGPCLRNHPSGQRDGCQKFEPSSEDPKVCDNCSCKRGFHAQPTIPSPQPVSVPSYNSIEKQETKRKSMPTNDDSTSTTESSDGESRKPRRLKRKITSSKRSSPILASSFSSPPSSPSSLSSNPTSPNKQYANPKNGNFIDISESSDSESLSDIEETPPKRNPTSSYIPSRSIKTLKFSPDTLSPYEMYRCKYPNQFYKLQFLYRFLIERLVSQNLLQISQFDDRQVEKISKLQIQDFVIHIHKMIQTLPNQKTPPKGKSQKKQVIVPNDGTKLLGKKMILRLEDAFSQGNQSYVFSDHTSLSFNCLIQEDCRVELDGPYIEQSSRSLRDFGVDRFLRVTFSDRRSMEKIRSLLYEGIYICGRKYEYFGQSASQSREHKCYFFATRGVDISPENEKSIESVRNYHGDFSDIASTAKRSARLGQAFSRTIPTCVVIEEHQETVPDIMNEKYCFTDGCGAISSDYAEKVADKLNLDFVPSVFQIRFGSRKGVVASNPNISQKIMFRPSMTKFNLNPTSDSQRTIEVIQWSKPLTASLNQQFIVLLNGLGVPDQYFLNLLDKAISDIQKISSSTPSAINWLTKRMSGEDYTSLERKALEMLLAGTNPETERHLKYILNQIQKSSYDKLKKKFKIPLNNAYHLIGISDPTGKLSYGQVFVQVSSSTISCVPPSKVVVSKNPCYHPGDVRLLEVVNLPDLNHLHNVIVFPTQGERPHPDEIAGSDLDGDQYFVCWDPELLSISQVPPADYTPIPRQAKDNKDFREQFMESLSTQSLGHISLLHTAHADMRGIHSEPAIELAMLFSRAVDSAKTGDIVKVPPYLTQNIKWPHFMEKGTCSYKSTSILGKLYDRVVSVIDGLKLNADPNSGQIDAPILDQGLLVEGYKNYLTVAKRELKRYQVEVGVLMKKLEGQDSSKKEAFENLYYEFREKFLECKKSDREMKASAYYYVAYTHQKPTSSVLKFPWAVCDDFLNRIKADSFGLDDNIETSKEVRRLSVSVTPSMISKFRIRGS